MDFTKIIKTGELAVLKPKYGKLYI
jgi:hypothetical protein